jgi:hypothetical protein
MKLPEDFTRHVRKLYRQNIPLASARDNSGRVTELAVPYNHPQEKLVSYHITRSGNNLEAQMKGRSTSPCEITEEQKRELRTIINIIDSDSQPAPPRLSPELLTVCT